MIDEKIRERLYQSVFMVKLVSGETLVALIASKSEVGISCFFPYEIDVNNEDSTFVLRQHCKLSYDRRFEISLFSCVYIKRPSTRLCDLFFDRVLDESTGEFKTFITKFTAAMLEPDIEDDEDVGDASIDADGIKTASERTLH